MAAMSYEDVLTSAQQLTTEEQARLIEDPQDAAWARDYEARKAAGQLTLAEQDVLPWDEALEEIERQRAARHTST